MLTTSPHTRVPARLGTRPRLRDEGGFTLIELLVAMIVGMMVMLALVAVLAFATRQETHLTNVAQATQLGRIAMTKVVDELHSACLAPGFAPIQENSGPSELRFVDAYSEKATLSKSEVNEHRVVWNEKEGTLVDETYPAVKEETWPSFEYASKPSSKTLIANNVSQLEYESQKLPIFQYFSYNLESNESTSSGLNSLNTTPILSGSEKLTEKTAATAASVLISFNVGSSASATSLSNTLGKTTAKDVGDGQQSQVTLSFSVPASEAESVDTPCQ
jgi:type II secretory pathway pseudopilin PulG